MNAIESILYFLQSEMNTPKAFGVFHISCLALVVVCILFLIKQKKNYSEFQLKVIIGLYGIVALMLETLKQLTWSFNYDVNLGSVFWDYEWYAFPFQLCSTPIYVTMICLFLKKGKLRDSLFSYLSYITILGSIATMIMPDNCFTSDILVNIHTMWLHLGSFVVSVYLLLTGEVKTNLTSLKHAILVFLIFLFLALSMNVVVYNLDILNGETFDMFYVSPYFISALPVFDIIQENTPYVIFLSIYTIAVILGSCVIYFISKNIKKFRYNRKSKI